MLKKEIQTTTFDGAEVTKTFYFNLTKVEVLKIDSKYPNGLKGHIESIVATDDKAAMMDLIETIIKASYGVRSGDDFIKTEALSEQFTHTEAYSNLVVELFSDVKNATEFFNRVVNLPTN